MDEIREWVDNYYAKLHEPVKVEINCKCMNCDKKYHNPTGYKYGLCESCKKTELYSSFEGEYSVSIY